MKKRYVMKLKKDLYFYFLIEKDKIIKLKPQLAK